jgi:hypothetical protein
LFDKVVPETVGAQMEIEMGKRSVLIYNRKFVWKTLRVSRKSFTDDHGAT